MLGRTANDLFWMSRYMERAENMARLLEVGYRIALLPREGHGQDEEWLSTLRSAGCEKGYLAKHGGYDTKDVVNFVLFAVAQPPRLIFPRHRAAPRRASALAHPRDVGEPAQRVAEFSPSSRHHDAPTRCRRCSTGSRALALFRGTLLNHTCATTRLFQSLGAFLERADNPRAPRRIRAAGTRDRRRRDRQREWAAILLSVRPPQLPWVSGQLPALAHRRYLTSTQMPRSLRSCYEES